jgi:hypothetical protein
MIKFFSIIITWILALIPTWSFLLLKFLIAPVGFVQNFLVFGLGIYFLGGLQILLAIIALGLSLKLMID